MFQESHVLHKKIVNILLEDKKKEVIPDLGGDITIYFTSW